MKAPSKEIRELLRKARKRGLLVERRGSKHYFVTNPTTGRSVTLAGSQGTRTAVRDYRKHIDRLGSAS